MSHFWLCTFKTFLNNINFKRNIYMRKVHIIVLSKICDVLLFYPKYEKRQCCVFIPVKFSEERQSHPLNLLSVPKKLVVSIIETKYSKKLSVVFTFLPDVFIFWSSRGHIWMGPCINHHRILLSW